MMTTNPQCVAANDGALLLTFYELRAFKTIADDAPVVTRDTYNTSSDLHIEWHSKPHPSQYNRGDEPVVMRGAWWVMVARHTESWAGSLSSFSQEVADRFVQIHKMTLITKLEFKRAEQTILDLMLKGNRHKRSVYRRAKAPVYIPAPEKAGRARVYFKGRPFVVGQERYLMMCSLHAKESRLKTLEEKINQIKERNNGKN